MVGSLGGDGDGGAPSGEGEGYVWTQTDDEVEIVVNVPAGTKAKDVHVTFKPRSLTVGLKGASPRAKPLVSLTKTFRAGREHVDDGRRTRRRHRRQDGRAGVARRTRGIR